MSGLRKTNRSAYANYLLAKYETYVGATEVRSYPYFLCLDPSDKCQLRCPTCPTGIENESRRDRGAQPLIFRSDRSVLTEDLIAALLDEMGEYLFLINFYNYGEPLLNKSLPNFIRRASAFDIDTEIHSNLSLPLSDAFIEDLLTSGLGHLQASIDGFSQETYERHRVGGDFGLATRNLERIAAARTRLGLSTEISYNFLVFSFNEHEMYAARAWAEDLGINFNDRDAFVDDAGWLPSYRRNEKALPIPESIRFKDHVREGWSPMPVLDEARCPPACGWHHGFSVVTAGGTVSPCCAVAKDRDDFGVVVPGSTRFADVWNNERFRVSRASFAGTQIAGLESLETICTKCPYPAFLKHLYAVYDAQIMVQYARRFGGADPVIDRAFDLLSRTRAGLPLDELQRHGRIPSRDELFIGHENRAGTRDFVEYFQHILALEPAVLAAGIPDRVAPR
jgi:MoaA/NifB/PqqE/SkfB family radical SAM enzyme